VLYLTVIESVVLPVADEVCQVVFFVADLGLDYFYEGWLEHF
jgi:hypothetical protein